MYLTVGKRKTNLESYEARKENRLSQSNLHMFIRTPGNHAGAKVTKRILLLYYRVS